MRILLPWNPLKQQLMNLFGNGEGIEHGIGPCIATVTVDRYDAAGDVDNAEIIGQRVIVHIPGGPDVRFDGESLHMSTAGAIQQLNNIVLPGGCRWCCLWIRKNAAVDGFAGIEM